MSGRELLDRADVKNDHPPVFHALEHGGDALPVVHDARARAAPPDVPGLAVHMHDTGGTRTEASRCRTRSAAEDAERAARGRRAGGALGSRPPAGILPPRSGAEGRDHDEGDRVGLQPEGCLDAVVGANDPPFHAL